MAQSNNFFFHIIEQCAVCLDHKVKNEPNEQYNADIDLVQQIITGYYYDMFADARNIIQNGQLTIDNLLQISQKIDNGQYRFNCLGNVSVQNLKEEGRGIN